MTPSTGFLNNTIGKLSFDGKKPRGPRKYKQEELYELHLISRAANSLARMLADIPVYKEIDMAAIPYVQVLLTSFMRDYFEDFTLTRQGMEEEKEQPLHYDFGSFRLMDEQQCRDNGISKRDKRSVTN
jgi:hypothetical protein